jgi:hypothetical protein
MIKLLTLIGARLQFIKAARVSRVVRAMDGVDEVIAHTGEYFDRNMSDIFLMGPKLSVPPTIWVLVAEPMYKTLNVYWRRSNISFWMSLPQRLLFMATLIPPWSERSLLRNYS